MNKEYKSSIDHSVVAEQCGKVVGEQYNEI